MAGADTARWTSSSDGHRLFATSAGERRDTLAIAEVVTSLRKRLPLPGRIGGKSRSRRVSARGRNNGSVSLGGAGSEYTAFVMAFSPSYYLVFANK
jgi:hypothetical protein